MNNNRSKLIAIFTGFVSIIICVMYLLFITVFDFRSFLNEQLSSHFEKMAAIFLNFDNLSFYLIY